MKYCKYILFGLLLLLSSCDGTEPVDNENTMPEVFITENIEIEVGTTPNLNSFVYGRDFEDGLLDCIFDDTNVNYNEVGLYQADCQVTDEDEDTATSSFIVAITDKVDPIIAVLSNHKTTYPIGTVIDFMDNVYIGDNYDNDCDIVIDDSLVVYNTPGSYDVTYTVTDSSGNETENVISYTLVKLDAPVLLYEITNIDYNHFDISYEISDPNQTFQSINIAIFMNGIQLLGFNSNEKEDDIMITALNSNEDYTVQLTVMYNLNGAIGNQQFIESNTVQTLAYQVPQLDVDIIDGYIDHVLLQLYVEDPDGVLLDATLYVKDGEDIIQTHNVTMEEVMIITDVLSNHNYSFELIHHYDLDDGMHVIEETQIESIHTPTASAPVFVINEFSYTTSSLIYDYDIVDPNMISLMDFNATITEEYGAHTEMISVNQLTDDEMIFTGLEPGREYRIAVEITYDLNDGTGEKTYEYLIEEIYTHYIDIVSYDINQTTIIQGEDIVVEMMLYNPFSLILVNVLYNEHSGYPLNEVVPGVYMFIIQTDFLPLGENIINIDAIVIDNLGDMVELEMNVNNEIIFTVIEPPS